VLAPSLCLLQTEIPGFSSDQQSLYCGNVCGDMMVQVVPTGARLVLCESLQLMYEYKASRTVTVAVGSSEQVVLALSGGQIIYLEVDPAARTLVLKASATLDQDIACLSLYEAAGGLSPDGDAAMAVEEEVQGQAKSIVLAVGMWTDNSVRLFAAQTLQELTRTQLGVDTQAQARDVVLVSLGEAAAATLYLMVGLGDGTLITFIVDFLDGLPKMTTRRKVVIGTHPISLTSFSNAGLPCVFASCDRPTVLSTRNGKLIFSVVNISEVTGMSPFHSEMFPECLALSSEVGLMIGTVDEIQKLHVQTYSLGESPRRIAHCSQSGVYAGELSSHLAYYITPCMLHFLTSSRSLPQSPVCGPQ
jgi:DNA damage-binding protein 1